MNSRKNGTQMSLAWLVVLGLAACTLAPAQPVEVTRLVEVTARPRPIRVAYSSQADVGDLPTLMALELLSEQGYAVLPTNYAQNTISIAALAEGGADIGLGSMPAHWAAVSQGAELLTVMEQVVNLWQIYAVLDIQECADLDGRRLAISGDSAVSAKMTFAYIAERCPGTEPEIVLIQGSQNRAAALLAGEIDATPVELADAIQLEHVAPGQLHTLTNFGQDLPGLKTTGIHVNRDFAAQHPEAVKDYLAAVLVVHRQIAANHELLIAEAARRLALEPELLPEVAEAHFAINAWDANGGLAEADVQYTLDFFTDTGALEPGLAVGDVANLSYLAAVLDEIGRQE